MPRQGAGGPLRRQRCTGGRPPGAPRQSSRSRVTITEAFEDLEAQPRAVPEGFEIGISLPGGRRQTVYIAETRSTFDNERLVRIWSPCGPVDDGYLLRALQINGEVYHGALAIQEFAGRPYFVMRNNYPSATCDPAEIRSSVLAIAKRSDEVESMLTGKDIH